MTPVLHHRFALRCCCIAASVVGSCQFLHAQQFVDQTATRFPQPDLLEYTNAITVGDIDGDADLDIVFANGGDTIAPGIPQKLRLYINNGSGIFTDESDARTGGLAFLARGAELGDIERDGDLDIIIAQDFNRQPTLLVNDGTGVFTDQTLTRLPIGLFSSSRAQFADVDNDGDLDLYLTNGGAVNRLGSARGKLWLNDGSGVYSDVTLANTPAQNVTEPIDCIFGDVDGDFDLDLRIASTATNQSKLYRNNGAGIFTNVAGLPSDNNCWSYDFGDIDLDNDLDLLGANGNASTVNNEILMRNNGTGGYTNHTWTGSNIDDRDSKFVDFDNDGDLDIVIAATGPNERAYSINSAVNPPSVSLTANIFPAIADFSLDLKVADFDNDGRYDVVTAQGESGNFANRIYMNAGPSDTIAPKIVKVEQLADTDNSAGPYFVRAVIYDAHTSDRGFHDKGVILNYTSNDGVPQKAEMVWVGNSVWRGSIPGQPIEAVVEYSVSATDFAGNTAVSPPISFEILHPPCPPDITGNLIVDVDDLLAVINTWGQTATTHNIAVSNNEFTPSELEARAGDTLKWNWVIGSHTVTSGLPCTADGMFNANIASPNNLTFSYVIPHDFSGPLPYFCVPHCGFGMTANVNVAPFKSDVTGNGIVDVDDLLAVINAWGQCP
jgi:plastocyanin